MAEKQPELPAAYYFLAIVHDNLGEYLTRWQIISSFKTRRRDLDNLGNRKVNLRLLLLQKQVNKVRKGEK